MGGIVSNTKEQQQQQQPCRWCEKVIMDPMKMAVEEESHCPYCLSRTEPCVTRFSSSTEEPDVPCNQPSVCHSCVLNELYHRYQSFRQGQERAYDAYFFSYAPLCPDCFEEPLDRLNELIVFQESTQDQKDKMNRLTSSPTASPRVSEAT